MFIPPTGPTGLVFSQRDLTGVRTAKTVTQVPSWSPPLVSFQEQPSS